MPPDGRRRQTNIRVTWEPARGRYVDAKSMWAAPTSLGQRGVSE